MLCTMYIQFYVLQLLLRMGEGRYVTKLKKEIDLYKISIDF